MISLESNRLIPFFPTLEPWSIISPESVKKIPSGAKFYARSRDVIYAAVKALNLSAGDVILAPASLCWDALEPFLSNGIIVRCYPLDTQLFANHFYVKNLVCPQTKAVYLVHYFGYPQPNRYKIRQLCDLMGLGLIEDCALCLFNESQDVGRIGDVSFFSLWKYFPLPDGAIGLTKNGIDLSNPNKSQSSATIARRVLSVVSRSSKLRLIIRGVIVDKPRPIELKFKNLIGIPRLQSQISMSKISSFIYSRCNVEEIAEKRRSNYSNIIIGIKNICGVTPLWEQIPLSCIPFCVPIKVKNPTATQAALENKMIETEISVNNFFKNCRQIQGDPNSFKSVELIASQVLSLPVHQGLTSSCINRMIKALHECIKY